jgi:hypothetical protein
MDELTCLGFLANAMGGGGDKRQSSRDLTPKI